MTILTTERNIRVAADEDKYLYFNGEAIKGCMCPINVDPLTIYVEVTKDKAVELISKFREENNIIDGQDIDTFFE